MTETDDRYAALASAIERFPDQRMRILRLALWDQSFGDLCQEYDLARKSYGRLQVSPDRAPEVAEYRTIIAELEEEIRRSLGLEADGNEMFPTRLRPDPV